MKAKTVLVSPYIMINTIGKIRIGISNGYMPGNKATFPHEYQSKSRLHYYSRFFNTIEVNSCFYKTPLRATYEKWVADVPDDFRFSLKLSKAITHDAALAADISCMENFLATAAGIGIKKGCLLIQFPGKITLGHFSQVERLLEQLRISDPSGEWRKAIEFRNESWYIGETTELLDEFDATMVIHDFAKAKLATTACKADFVYMRFHGPAGNYRDAYTAKFLEEKAVEIKTISASGKDVYAYFNNTIGEAFENAGLLHSSCIDVAV